MALSITQSGICDELHMLPFFASIIPFTGINSSPEKHLIVKIRYQRSLSSYGEYTVRLLYIITSHLYIYSIKSVCENYNGLLGIPVS